ncbi:hypothetical protein V9K67_09140 [Paraflavisolibacter sp. H34]|uniref:hypothetical protein n=1 Tax=Huijunlia imazamoxiresistens TaxID=3127457 RepID=UPI00301B1CA3
MNDEIVNTVLTEILQEQKSLNGQKQKEGEAMGQLLEKVQTMEEYLLELKATVLVSKPEPLDISQLEAAITKEVRALRWSIESQPKEITMNKRFLLFPDGQALQYFKLLYIGGLASLVIFFLLVELHWSFEANKNLPYKKAWQLLYSMEREDGKMFLEEVWNESKKKEPQPLKSKLCANK